jgi:hypothetical protein
VQLGARFHKLFLGLERAYGTYQVGKKEATGKMSGRARTLQEPVTDNLWTDHLKGEQGLGIIPINDENECNWAAIDIDIYDGLNHKQIEQTIRELNIPLLPCTTKSGGLHLYLFMNEPAKAVLIRRKMAEWATILGHGNAEIFPKQNELHDNIGNWINMPYFHCNSPQSTRYGLRNGKRLKPTAFLNFAEKLSLSLTELKKTEVQIDSDLVGAPPCIKTLWVAGIPQGNRDKGLFSVGVYLKKKFEDDWEDRLHDFNRGRVKPCLSGTNVSKIVKSLNNKDFMYICKDQPLFRLCNRDECAKVKYGVGSSGPGVELTHLRHIKTSAGETIGFSINVNGHDLEFDNMSQLIELRKFREKCAESIYVLPNNCKGGIWDDIIRKLLSQVEIISAPDDASEGGQFITLFETFIGQGVGRNIDDILAGMAFIDGNKIKFRSETLLQFLKSQKLQIKPERVWSLLKKRMKAIKERRRIKGKVTRLWVVEKDCVELQTEEFDVPDITQGM